MIAISTNMVEPTLGVNGYWVVTYNGHWVVTYEVGFFSSGSGIQDGWEHVT
jgi:hypothetical protein